MTITSQLKSELIKKTNLLGNELALLPYECQAIDNMILQLEQNNPNELPFQTNSLSFLLGNWKLIYASKGTAITSQLKNFPDAKIKKITQNLSLSQKENQIFIKNQGFFEFPWLGNWNLSTTGTWDYELETQVSLIKFDRFIFEGSNILGMSNWKLPSLQFTTPFMTKAKWITSYLDAELRIGRGITGNLFVFLKSE